MLIVTCMHYYSLFVSRTYDRHAVFEVIYIVNIIVIVSMTKIASEAAFNFLAQYYLRIVHTHCTHHITTLLVHKCMQWCTITIIIRLNVVYMPHTTTCTQL